MAMESSYREHYQGERLGRDFPAFALLINGAVIKMNDIDKQIEETVNAMASSGMSMAAQDISDLTRVLRGEISFEDLIQSKINEMINQGPNIDVLREDSDEADAELDRRFRQGLSIMLDEKRRLGFPITRYDQETRISWLEYPWGQREYDFDKTKNND